MNGIPIRPMRFPTAIFWSEEIIVNGRVVDQSRGWLQRGRVGYFKLSSHATEILLRRGSSHRGGGGFLLPEMGHGGRLAARKIWTRMRNSLAWLAGATMGGSTSLGSGHLPGSANARQASRSPRSQGVGLSSTWRARWGGGAGGREESPPRRRRGARRRRRASVDPTEKPNGAEAAGGKVALSHTAQLFGHSLSPGSRLCPCGRHGPRHPFPPPASAAPLGTFPSSSGDRALPRRPAHLCSSLPSAPTPSWSHPSSRQTERHYIPPLPVFQPWQSPPVVAPLTSPNLADPISSRSTIYNSPLHLLVDQSTVERSSSFAWYLGLM